MRTERFNKAYDALVKAFFEGTLGKGNCTACAVGNIVGASMEADIRIFKTNNECTIYSDKDNNFWGDLFVTTKRISGFSIFGYVQKFKSHAPKSSVDRLEKMTGYTLNELAKIEYAFEKNTRLRVTDYHRYSDKKILRDQFKGLCAVVDVLLKLDNITPEDHYKNKFREHPQLIY